MGDGFTAVDAYLLPYYQWADAEMELDVEGSFPKYAALVRRVMIRESVRKALEREAMIKEEMGGEEAFEGNR